MRRLCALVFASSLWLLPSAFGGEGAVAGAQVIRPSPEFAWQRPLDVAYRCGMTNGSFGCSSAPPAVHGKNATPGVNDTPPEEAPASAAPEQGATAPLVDTGQGAPSPATQELVKPGEHACPPGYRVLAVPTQSGYCEPLGTPAAANATCQHGMLGTPPNNCHCPKDSELLGGNCVHYTAICHNGLAANETPQPCAGADAKLACKLRPDGLKDCCCLTYDKL
jgi:hypothetical protein